MNNVDYTKYWTSKGFSVRASNVLASAGIFEIQSLLKKLRIFTDVIQLRNCGKITAKEIWSQILRLRDSSNGDYDRQKQISEQNYTANSKQIFIEIPLLNQKISTDLWSHFLQVQIDEIEWTTRTQLCLIASDCSTLADVALKFPEDFLKYRNFGKKSLNEIKQKVLEIINKKANDFNQSKEKFDKADLLKKKESIKSIDLTDQKIQTLNDLAEFLLSSFSEREKLIIEQYYGFDGSTKTLKQIGEILDVTKERIRQIKEKTNRRVRHSSRKSYVTKFVLSNYEKLIINTLVANAGILGIVELRQLTEQYSSWRHKDLGIINWFDDAFGKKWLFSGSKNYEVKNNVCQIVSDNSFLNALSNLIEDLQNFGYKPLTFKNTIEYLNQKTNKILTEQEIFNYLQKHPQLKIHEFGDFYIGLKDWEWFNASNSRSTKTIQNLVEWFFRLINKPCTVEEISQGILERIGDFKIDTFSIAAVCNSRRFHFSTFEYNKFGLEIWKYASNYKKKLEAILNIKGEQHIKQILKKFTNNNRQLNSIVIASLHFYKTTFKEKKPFIWTLTNQIKNIQKNECNINHESIPFEELIPN